MVSQGDPVRGSLRLFALLTQLSNWEFEPNSPIPTNNKTHSRWVLLLARPERFELPTNWFEASYSIQLSYGRVDCGLYMFLLNGVTVY